MPGFICRITGVRQRQAASEAVYCISFEDAGQVMEIKESYVGMHLAVRVQLLVVVSMTGAISQIATRRTPDARPYHVRGIWDHVENQQAAIMITLTHCFQFRTTLTRLCLMCLFWCNEGRDELTTTAHSG